MLRLSFHMESPMNTTAYVLIEADTGQIAHAIATLREIPGIASADLVTGPYDIIVTINTNDQREVGRLVINAVHALPGIKRTITCLAIDS
jgi:DNA-binding Lrp family transcriptional regulator